MRRSTRAMVISRSLRGACVAVLFVAIFGISGCSNPASLATPFAVPEANQCAQGDHPEAGLQGQVPAALRARGFQGFNCNLKLVGQYRGEGGGWSAAVFNDPSGHVCAYYGTGASTNILTGQPIARVHPGVAVIDITNPARPVRTTSLTTPAMLDPWESLRVNPRRQVLAADAGSNSTQGSAYVDFYDLSGDCRYPQLLASTDIGTGQNGGIMSKQSVIGHEGGFSPDGMIYWIGDIVHETYDAVDITNMTKPKLIAQLYMKSAPLAGAGYNGDGHGLSISDDGNRAYVVSAGFPTTEDLSDSKYKTSDGFYVVDTSEVQVRKPDARMRLISAVAVRGGSLAQHTLPFRVAGRSYLVFVDEGGAVGDLIPPPAAGYAAEARAACNAGLSPFPMARIYDLSDERHPKLVSTLALEVNDPKNCAKVLPDIAGLSIFTYGTHYCSVDNRDNATALACAEFNSGVRVFDIRDPAHPKEIAYYNPAGATTAQAGSIHVMARQCQPGGPDWCTAQIDFDYGRHLLTTMCQDNGLLVMKFENGVWPMPQSTPSREQH